MNQSKVHLYEENYVSSRREVVEKIIYMALTFLCRTLGTRVVAAAVPAKNAGQLPGLGH